MPITSRFFLAANGKSEPLLELRENYKYLFSDAAADKEFRCKYPARYRFLCEKLNKKCDLSFLSCPKLSAWLAPLKGSRLNIIFASAFLENPASMFGHTFLRLDNPNRLEAAPILEQTVNFAARTNNRERGLFFALKGLTGAFRGTFSMSPYFTHVREYGDIDNRDLWEYELSFTDEEISWMLLHLWELKNAYFDYYFIDENCSFHLLGLLDAARPSLRLSSEFKWYAVPSDTLRSVINRKDLLKKVHYRPAKTIIIREQELRLSNTEKVLAKALVDKSNDPGMLKTLGSLPERKHAMILELAYDYSSYKFNKTGEIQSDRIKEKLHWLLSERNKLNVPSQRPPLDANKAHPVSGHKSRRARLALGYENDSFFLEPELRFLYHDSMDPSAGFMRGASLEFLKAAFRFYTESEKTEFEKLEIIAVRSAPPRGFYIKPFSWLAYLGAERQSFDTGRSSLIPSARLAGGLSYAPYEVFDFNSYIGGDLSASGRFIDGFNIAPTAEISLGYAPIDKLRIAASANTRRFILDAEKNTFQFSLEQRLTISANSALALKISRAQEFGPSFESASLSLLLYF